MQKKKLLAILISLATITSLSTACKNSGGTGSKNTPGGKTEISYMAWYNNETEPKETQKSLDKFNSSQDRINVKLVSVPYADYVTKLNTMASSNSLPDTAMMMESQVIKWAVNGRLLDISDMYSGNDAPLDSLAFKYKGKAVAYSAANEVLLLYYNKDIFDKAGIAYPPASADKAWTWQEFVDAAKKLTKDKNGKTPSEAGFDNKNIVTYGCNFNTISWMWPVLAISNGGGLVSQDGKELLLGKPETIEAAQAIADLNLKEYVAPTPATLATFPTLDVTLLSGKVAMATSGQWEIGVSLKNSLKDGLHYGVGVLPKMKTPVTLNTGGPNVIFNTTKNPDASKSFMKWYTNEDNNISLIQSGVWMPTSKKWYQEEELIKKWVDNNEHPPVAQYKTAVIDYAMKNAQQVPWYFFPGYDRMDEIIGPGMDPVWTGKTTAKDAILNDILPKVQKIFDENKIK
jgi:multiple sugar transport system substrate-binding protein